MRQAGGIWTRQDLANYRVVEREPIRSRYRDMRLVSASPPSSGGVALAEMAFSGGLGVTARLDKVPAKRNIKKNDILLFSESNTRFLVEVDPKNQSKF